MIEEPAVETTKQCPFCAETIQAAAIVCRYCGRDLVARATEPAVSSKPRRRKWPLVFLGLVAILGVAGALSYAMLFRPGAPAAAVVQTCPEQAQAYIAHAQSLLKEWDDANTLAGKTARVSLAPQIEHLQALRRQAEALDAPACATEVRQRLLDIMDFTIQGYLSFMAQESDTKVSSHFDDAKRAQDNFIKAIAALK